MTEMGKKTDFKFVVLYQNKKTTTSAMRLKKSHYVVGSGGIIPLTVIRECLNDRNLLKQLELHVFLSG